MFDHAKPNKTKLLAQGFEQKGGEFFRAFPIMEGQFEMQVRIEGNEVEAKLFDTGSGEEYVLHRVEGAGGAFVGEVRAAYEDALARLERDCFEKDHFESDGADALIAYVREKYGDEPEYLWDTLEDAVWRRKDNRKWYGVLLTIPRCKLGLAGKERTVILDLRMDPQKLAAIVDGETYFHGWHMNKKHWVTVCLDGSLPIGEICSLIDDSYTLAKKK